MNGIYVGSLDKDRKDLLLKLNPDFIWIHNLSKENSSFLRKNNIKAFYSIGVFDISSDEQGEGFSAVDKSGNSIKTFSGWYRGGCPSNNTLREKRLKEIRREFNTGFYEGVWLDSIRFPTYWETKIPEYLNTCYCETCLEEHRKSGVGWEDFRINQIVSFLKEVRGIIGDRSLGYFAVPETEEKLYKVFAQPPKEFEKIVDYVSPMVYPQMVGKDLDWVSNTLNYFQKFFTKDRIIPIIQVVKMPESSNDVFREREFKDLAAAVAGHGHSGYFMLDQLLKDKGRQKAVIKLFRKGEKK